MAKNKWVLITSPGKLSRIEWEQFVKQSYELVKSKLSKKTQEGLGEDKWNKLVPLEIAEAGEQARSTRSKVTRKVQPRSGGKNDTSAKKGGKSKVGPAKKKARSKTATKKKSK